MERARRLRVRSTQPDLRGSRETLPGPTMWVRPVTGWWGRMNVGESPRNQGLSVKGAPVRLQKAVSRLKENAAVERREARRSASRTGSSLPLEGPARSQGRATGCGVPHQRLSALRSLTFGEGDLPSSAEGMEMPGAPRALREQGRRSFGTFLAGCLTCESDVRAHEKRERVLAERTRGLPARSRDRIPRRRSSPAALGFIPPSGSACTPAAALTSRAASARPTASAPPVFW